MRKFFAGAVFLTSILVWGDEPVLLISDVDDTIKRTHVLGSTWDFAKNGLRDDNPFVGMAELYSAVACQGLNGLKLNFCLEQRALNRLAERITVYLSSAPGKLRFMGREFVSVSGFPVGDYIGRESSSEDALEFKVRNVLRLGRALENYKLVLVGDNGERDSLAYDRISKDLVLSKRSAVFIHQIYGPDKGAGLAPGQIPFLTAADLALHFYRRGWIDIGLLKTVSQVVLLRLESRDLKIFETVLPEWVECREFWRFYERPAVDLTADLKDVFARIEGVYSSRCR